MNDARERLENSRARLRLALAPPLIESQRSSFKSGAISASQRESWLHRLAELSSLRAALESLSAWWSHHPLRPIAQVANEASTAAVRPIAQRNPLTLVLAAAGIGAILSFARPWRWIFRSALFAGLVPQLAARIVGSLPIESWMAMASSAMARSTRGAPRTAVGSTSVQRPV